LLTLTQLRDKDLELDFGRELREVDKKAKAIDVKPAGPTPEAISALKTPGSASMKQNPWRKTFPTAVALAYPAPRVARGCRTSIAQPRSRCCLHESRKSHRDWEGASAS